METNPTENAENTGRLITLVRGVYPDVYMTIRHWKTFPPDYAIMSGDLTGKYGDFMLGWAESKERAWTCAWDTVEQLMLYKLWS